MKLGAHSKNHGNDYGKSNIGKKYNTVHTDINGYSPDSSMVQHELMKLATFEKDGKVHNCTAWYDNGDVYDNASYKALIKKASHWHKEVYEYYRGDTLVYTSVTYCKYYNSDRYYERQVN